jgi:hypothetical protein
VLVYLTVVERDGRPFLQALARHEGGTDHIYLIDPNGGSLTVTAHGGGGGRGGDGGPGGDGGDGSEGAPDGRAGDGGHGGNGGHGAPGGPGGAIVVHADPRVLGLDRSLVFSTRGGAGGRAGRAGRGGTGGSGSSGSDGVTGYPGRPGPDGEPATMVVGPVDPLF